MACFTAAVAAFCRSGVMMVADFFWTSTNFGAYSFLSTAIFACWSSLSLICLGKLKTKATTEGGAGGFGSSFLAPGFLSWAGAAPARSKAHPNTDRQRMRLVNGASSWNQEVVRRAARLG